MHTISGVLGSPDAVARAANAIGGTSVALDAGIVWLPWRGRRFRTLDDESIPEHELLDDALATRLAAVSGDDGLAFLETRYFGGAGGQVATAWIGGRRVVDRGTVNDALRALGVVCADGKRDEWATVGLERHRSNPR